MASRFAHVLVQEGEEVEQLDAIVAQLAGVLEASPEGAGDAVDPDLIDRIARHIARQTSDDAISVDGGVGAADSLMSPPCVPVRGGTHVVRRLSPLLVALTRAARQRGGPWRATRKR